MSSESVYFKTLKSGLISCRLKPRTLENRYLQFPAWRSSKRLNNILTALKQNPKVSYFPLDKTLNGISPSLWCEDG